MLFCVCCACAGEIGLNVDVGLGMKLNVEGTGFEGKGYIPCHCSCHSIKSASLVTHSIIVAVSYNSGKVLMSS